MLDLNKANVSYVITIVRVYSIFFFLKKQKALTYDAYDVGCHTTYT